jgi:hypothetical protein
MAVIYIIRANECDALRKANDGWERGYKALAHENDKLMEKALLLKSQNQLLRATLNFFGNSSFGSGKNP